MMEEPFSGFHDGGKPAWQEIRELFDGASMEYPPQRVMDELAGMLLWARWGKAAAERKAREDAMIAAVINTQQA
jgi:hypothetical protein